MAGDVHIAILVFADLSSPIRLNGTETFVSSVLCHISWESCSGRFNPRICPLQLARVAMTILWMKALGSMCRKMMGASKALAW